MQDQEEILTPSYHGELCGHNGDNPDYEIACNEGVRKKVYIIMFHNFSRFYSTGVFHNFHSFFHRPAGKNC